MSGVRTALESERRVEQEFVERAKQTEKAPKGWPAALLMFHLGMWRERLYRAMSDLSEGRVHSLPTASVDDINDAELADAIGTPLADAAARSDLLLSQLIELYEKVGERPFQWFRAQTTTEAILRNSCVHPRNHLFTYLRENGDDDAAAKMFEDGFADMAAAGAPPWVLETARYNLACANAVRGETDAALDALSRALAARPELRAEAAADDDLAALRDDPRFQELLRT